VILNGLKRNGVEIIHCNVKQAGSGILSRLRLMYDAIRKIKVGFDIILVGYPGWDAIPFGKMLSKILNKPIVFDSFLSLYDTYVFDRGSVGENSHAALSYYLSDKHSCEVSDLVLLDTYQHIEYFSKTFHIDKGKFRRVLIGADDEVFYPRQVRKTCKTFHVTFWGSFIPLQGIKYIVEASKILEHYRDVKFDMMGSGQTYESVTKLARDLGVNNISFLKWIPYETLPNRIAEGSVSLGIFGDTMKTTRVIPNKVYEALAMGMPLITGDSPAAHEILLNRKNCIMVPLADPKALAEAIITLKEDVKLRNEVASEGYRLFQEKLNPTAIGKDLKVVLTELIERTK
jgi:glycosyltransferase involved in cell wall biosynthesis